MQDTTEQERKTSRYEIDTTKPPKNPTVGWENQPWRQPKQRAIKYGDPIEFAELSEDVFGSNWRYEVHACLGIDQRTVYRWAAGEPKPPKHVLVCLRAMAQLGRRRKIWCLWGKPKPSSTASGA